MRQFPDKLTRISEDSPNSLYKTRVYTDTRNTTDNTREGAINRFLNKMEAKFINTKSILPRNNTGTQKSIVGEIVANSSDNRSRRRQELEQLKQDLD